MGTRNKTMLIKNGKTIINQYGQWDGYPTGASATIVNFLKENGKEALEDIVKKLKPVEVKENKVILSEMTLSFSKDYSDIQKYIDHDENGKYKQWNLEGCDEPFYFSSLPVKNQVEILSEKFDYEKFSTYLMLTRNTGYKVFDVMKCLSDKFPEKEIPVIYDDYDGFDIEAKNIINLDTNTYTIDWHNKIYHFDLDNLPDMEKLEEIKSIGYEESYLKDMMDGMDI